MRELSHMVTAAESGRTVKSLALKALRLSQGQFSSLKFQGGIWVDGAPARANERLREGQVLSARLQDAGQKIAPAAIPISIPWQDGDYLIAEKPAPLPTLPSPVTGWSRGRRSDLCCGCSWKPGAPIRSGCICGIWAAPSWGIISTAGNARRCRDGLRCMPVFWPSIIP